MNTPKLLAWLQGSVALGTRALGALRTKCEELPGFGFSETMSGTLQRTPNADADGEPERKLVFHLEAEVPRLASYLRDGRTAISGEISIDGVAHAAPLTGSLWIWPHRNIIRYQFSFLTDSRQQLFFNGQKDIRLLAFKQTMTTLPAELKTDAGQLFGRATVHFAMADLPAFVRSFHPVCAARSPTSAAPPAPPEPTKHAISAF